MRTLRAWLIRFGNVFSKQRRDDELADELESHLQMNVEDNVRAGMTPEEARRQALIKLGGIEQTKEKYRERRGIPWLDSLWQDIRFGLRMLRKNPGFTAVAVLTLALGIGANTAIFSVVNAVLLRPLPYPDPGRLVRIWESSPKDDSPRNVVNPQNFMDWRDQARSFETMASVSSADANINVNGDPIAVPAIRVSPDFFSVLRVPPLLGRTFIPEDGIAGHERVVILSYQLWRGEFGGNPAAVGQKLELDDAPSVVIGVMPEGFYFPGLKADLWIPEVLVRDAQSTGGRYLTVVARLKPGATLEQAQQDMASAARFTAQLRPDFNRNWGALVVPLLKDVTFDVRRPLWVLLASVGFLLLIACANMANLLLMRGTVRLREIAIRSALGAARFRIFQQLLIESLLLAFAGMAAGLLLAYLGLHALLTLIPENAPLPRSEHIAIDARVFLFTFGATLFTALLFGSIPALRLSRTNPQKALSEGTLRSGVGGNLMLRRSFVVAEIALALLLSVGAGLMLRSFARLISVDPGFNPQHLVTMHIWTSPSRYGDALKRSQYVQHLLVEIRNSPGVESAGSVHFLPLTDNDSGSCFASIDQPPPTINSPGAQFLVVSSDYFRTMGTSLLSGREFDDRDRFAGPSVAVVNRAFVEKFSSNQNILGRQFNVCWTVKNPVEIVGVVADARQAELQETPEPTIFLCNAQAPKYFASIVVRAEGDPRQIMRTAEEAIHRVDPDQSVSDLRAMDTVFSDSVSSPRFQMVLLLVFAAIALALAMIGVYGVVSNSVNQRTQEIGIRMALGAPPVQVARMILQEALLLSAIAVVIGVTASLALTRLLQALLFETSPTDFVTLLVGSGGVLAIASLSALLPARRAMRVDPMVALRHE